MWIATKARPVFTLQQVIQEAHEVQTDGHVRWVNLGDGYAHRLANRQLVEVAKLYPSITRVSNSQHRTIAVRRCYHEQLCRR